VVGSWWEEGLCSLWKLVEGGIGVGGVVGWRRDCGGRGSWWEEVLWGVMASLVREGAVGVAGSRWEEEFPSTKTP
jgi:hypothetical protein